MKNVCVGVLMAMVLMGCATTEKKVRVMVADELVKKMGEWKPIIVNQPCSEIDKQYDVLTNVLKQEILK